MRFAVESWAADYGAPVDAPADDTQPNYAVDETVELDASDWRPLSPSCGPVQSVVFVDGVQQMDARIWVVDDDGISRMGECVSFAAGAVRCEAMAQVEAALVGRAVFAPAGFGSIDCSGGIYYQGVAAVDTTQQGLDRHVQRHRDDLEVDIALSVSDADLIVIDGHLSRREGIPGAVGYIKSHQVHYLSTALDAVVGRLAPGQRTPVFLLEAPGYARYSWYVKLPGGEGHPWAGVVRCEASSSLEPAGEVSAFADRVAATLPRFASAQYKDTRAPQNLYPVAGLERELRHRLGDRELLLRALQRASRAT